LHIQSHQINQTIRKFLATMLYRSLAVVLLIAAPVIAQETSEQFRRMDRNQDGKLTRDEFSGPLFDQIDTDKDGIITADEDRTFVKRQVAAPGQLQRIPESIKVELDIPYAGTDNPRQRLDLYLPKNPKGDKPMPVVVFVHGGGWQAGDKRGGFGTVRPLVITGEYVGVSVGDRLTGEAIWPAQIHDCKAAIRWLRANAKKYNLDPDHIGVTGNSAGGHLVAMLGTSGDVLELEGVLGEHVEESSRVACVVDQFGPTDLLAMGGSHNNPNSPESRLVGGGAIQENKDAARKASPITYVSKDDPPFMLIHGTRDPVVPFNQSDLLVTALKNVGVEALLVPVRGGGHGNFATDEVPNRMKHFFDKHLRGQEVLISTEPIELGIR
jgi:acetyl esterase/lipase